MLPTTFTYMGGGMNNRNLFQHNAVQYNTTTNYNLNNKHVVKLISLYMYHHIVHYINVTEVQQCFSHVMSKLHWER